MFYNILFLISLGVFTSLVAEKASLNTSLTFMFLAEKS